MNNKTIIWTVVIIIILALLFIFVGKGDEADVALTPNTNTTADMPAETSDRTIAGTVVIVDTSQVPADGPVVLNVRQDNGTETVVLVPSMGINLCAAQANIADVATLKSGDKVEVRGGTGPTGEIVPCESSAHYLRVVTQ